MTKSRINLAALLPAFAILVPATVVAFAGGCNNPPIASGGSLQGIFTYHGDNARTGQNTQESTLTPANVDSRHFGLLFSLPLDGNSYTQPLYVSGLDMGSLGVHNVVFVGTQHDGLYAFDADGATRTPLWYRSFIDPANGITPVSWSDVGTRDIYPEIGITGTPVIDPATGTLYVVSKTMESGKIIMRLHAIDITNGQDRSGSPVKIEAVANGSGLGSDGNGHIVLDPQIENQRAALALNAGKVYLCFGSHGDNGPYHGWILSYDAATLKQLAVFNDTPEGTGGWAGIWMSGGGPAIDSDGSLLVSTGNGGFSADQGGPDYGDSVVRLDADLKPMDYFTPYNQQELDEADLDLASGGVLILPDQPGAHPHLAVNAGKTGSIYLLDRDRLGGFSNNGTSNSQIVQDIEGQIGGLFATPSYWNGKVYMSGYSDHVKVFGVTNGRLSSAPLSQTDATTTWPSAGITISASGQTNGIAWALIGSGNPAEPSVLHAYDANDLSRELYSSNQVVDRDGLNGLVKFTVPTVANGKVYVNSQGRLNVFGLLGK